MEANLRRVQPGDSLHPGTRHIVSDTISIVAMIDDDVEVRESYARKISTPSVIISLFYEELRDLTVLQICAACYNMYFPPYVHYHSTAVNTRCAQYYYILFAVCTILQYKERQIITRSLFDYRSSCFKARSMFLAPKLAVRKVDYIYI